MNFGVTSVGTLCAVVLRGVVVRNAVERRSGKYFVAGTALRQISLATGGTLTLKRSGKSRRTRQVDPRSVYFLAQIAPNAEFGIKNLKKNSGGDTPGPPVREKANPSSAVRGGASSPIAGT